MTGSRSSGVFTASRRERTTILGSVFKFVESVVAYSGCLVETKLRTDFPFAPS